MLADDREAVTHDRHHPVLRAAGRGDDVRMESRILKKGRSLCFIDVSATVSGQLIATARITKSIVRKTG